MRTQLVRIGRLGIVATMLVGLSGCSYNTVHTSQEESIKARWAQVQRTSCSGATI